MSTSNGGGVTPPYMSFTTFENFLDDLKATTIPPKIDRTVMSGKSGAVQSQLRTTFTFLGLIREDETVTNRLKELVGARGTDEWQAAIRRIIEESYAPFFDGLPLADGTAGQLHHQFREIGDVAGSTQRKAIRFFLNALDAAGIEHSPHFKPPTAPRRDRSRSNRKPKEALDKSDTNIVTANNEGDPPAGQEKIQFPLPRRGSPVTILIPSNIAAYEWDMVDNYVRSYITAANMED